MSVAPNLLDLPVEIRIRIYRLVFVFLDHPFDTLWVRVGLHFTNRVLVKTHVWPLFQVCHQIYDEIMPEYYAATDFHFNSLVHLREILSQHRLFRQYVRHLVLNPQSAFPRADELSALPNLHTFAIANVACHEPLGTPRGTALDHAVLKRVLEAQDGRHAHVAANSVGKTFELRDEMARLVDPHQRQDIHLLLRFRYSYIERSKHPDGWGGKTDKRHRVIDYDCTDDVFTLREPDADEHDGRIIPKTGSSTRVN